MSSCNTCFHPCHCGEDIETHVYEYGACDCLSCECNKDVDKTFENEVEKSNGG